MQKQQKIWHYLKKLVHTPEAVLRFTPKLVLRAAGILAALVLVLFIASYFLDEPLRRYTENKLNQDLKGYSVRLPGLHFQLIGLTMTLKGLTVFQNAHPSPPIAISRYFAPAFTGGKSSPAGLSRNSGSTGLKSISMSFS